MIPLPTDYKEPIKIDPQGRDAVLRARRVLETGPDHEMTLQIARAAVRTLFVLSGPRMMSTCGEEIKYRWHESKHRVECCAVMDLHRDAFPDFWRAMNQLGLDTQPHVGDRVQLIPDSQGTLTGQSRLQGYVRQIRPSFVNMNSIEVEWVDGSRTCVEREMVQVIWMNRESRKEDDGKTDTV